MVKRPKRLSILLVRLKPLYFDILYGDEAITLPKKRQQIQAKYQSLIWGVIEIKSISIAGESFNLYILKNFPKELPVPFEDEIEIMKKGQLEFSLD